MGGLAQNSVMTVYIVTIFYPGVATWFGQASLLMTLRIRSRVQTNHLYY